MLAEVVADRLSQMPPFRIALIGDKRESPGK
jgi:hypothetical protein